MHEHAYKAQCDLEERRHQAQAAERRVALTLFALALGTFAIGTGEFGSNGVVQLIATDLDVSVPTATNAVTAYALGVVVGSPVLTIVAARLNRRTLLLFLVGLFLVGNILSALASDLGLLAIARFVTGTVQGAYFGAGAVVAAYAYGPGKGGKAFATVMAGLTVATIFGSPLGTFIGQRVGWQALYLVVAATGLVAGVAIWFFVPRTPALDGGSVTTELGALRRPMVWVTTAIAALGISSIFAVYTFIGPYITDAVGADESWIPVALAVFGLGMAVGNWVGGRLADQYEHRGLVTGYAGVLVFLVVIGLRGDQLAVLLPCLFGVGATTMMAIPTIQVLLTRYAPEAPTLMGAVNLAALNLANALGAVGGALALGAGWGTLSTAWAGLALTAAGLLLFAVTVPRAAPPAMTEPTPAVA
ncbi:MFS transporter [Nocardioides cavernae]|uniref:MFS transporter n=1 Tax=Nocardioides cavernae TaxID=1921566 RepID=A0ABR8N6F3_9ACTN|nr:MFS transporter [Nocardioides cavernae]MBD3923077.1 MFS transporter [Nocardioides cavernae]MBM7512003.1 DHA1 family inner membrane transport protein [Nocardioides cavernae]